MSVINGQPKPKRFTTVRLGGYDVAEVDRTVDALEQTVREAEQAIESLRERLAACDQRLREEEAETARLAAGPGAVSDDRTEGRVEGRAEDAARNASRSASRLLEIAARGADELTADARQEAAGILAEARAEAEAQRREHAERRAEAEAEVERLRAFEREHRQRLVAWFEGLLETVGGSAEDPVHDEAGLPVGHG